MLLRKRKKIASKKFATIIDCECEGNICCYGRGIAVFEVVREGKKIKVCTRCDLRSDKNQKILKYVKRLDAGKLIEFDSLGAVCLARYIRDKTYPFTK